jgi:putative Mn2+ efflux pump MntP
MDILTMVAICMCVCIDGMIVAMCKGLALKDVTLRSAAIVGLWFGVFHGIMPVIGYLIGSGIYDYISKIDHWILCAVLCYIGIMLIKEAKEGEEEGVLSSSLSVRTMLPLSVAVSLDAMAVGISFSAVGEGPVLGPLLIGVMSFAMCGIGVFVGGRFGMRFGKIAGIAGGIILIALGIFSAIQGELLDP